MKKVLITGAGGFIGKNLIESFKRRDSSIIALRRPKINQFNNSKDLSGSEIFCDMRDRINLVNALQHFDPHYIIHLAGENHVSGREGPDFTNVIDENLLHAAQSLTSLRKLIFLGSCDEYGNSNVPYIESQTCKPTSSYGYSKLETTTKLIELNEMGLLPSVILRPSVVYGKYQKQSMFIPNLLHHMKNGTKFEMTDGRQFRDFLFVDDLIESIWNAVDSASNLNGEIINIASGISVSILQVIEYVVEKLGSEYEKYVEIGSKAHRESEVFNYSVDNSKAKKLLNWEPKTQLKDGLEILIENEFIDNQIF